MPAETHSQRELTRADVESVVVENLVELTGRPTAAWSTQTPLDLDDVAVLDLLRDCEEELAERGVGLDPGDEIDAWRTIGDVVAYLCTALGVEQ
jgi:acyl carrier protein